MRYKGRMGLWLRTLLCLWTVCACFPGLAEDTPSLPIDFSGGMPLRAACMTGHWQYSDPTISVSIEEKSYSAEHGDCAYWVATVKIGHASQLRTASADNFASPMVMNGAALARRVNAVLAINGDYFFYTEEGYIMRQGQLFYNVLRGRRDVLLIDEDGDFHIVHYAKKADVGDTVNGKRVINALFFGPSLVEKGSLYWEMDLRPEMAALDKRQRMCIAQVGPLEYKCICCGPPARGSTGMTMMEFAKIVAKEGVQTAYNLDGGNSCMMFFCGEKVNDVTSTENRDISDIIYFASAWGGEP